MKVRQILPVVVAAATLLSSVALADGQKYQTALSAVYGQRMAAETCTRAGHNGTMHLVFPMEMNGRFFNGLTDYGNTLERYNAHRGRDKIWADVEAQFNKVGSNRFAATARGFIGKTSPSNPSDAPGLDLWSVIGEGSVTAKRRSWNQFLSDPKSTGWKVICDNLAAMIIGVDAHVRAVHNR